MIQRAASSGLSGPLSAPFPQIRIRMMHSATDQARKGTNEAGLGLGISTRVGKTVVQLAGLPPNATPADVRRMAAKYQVIEGFEVRMRYNRYRFAERATLHFTYPWHAHEAAERLDKVELATYLIHAYARVPNGEDEGALKSQTTDRGRTVILKGLKKGLTVGGLKERLLAEQFQLSSTDGSIIKLPWDTTEMTKWLVHLESVSEAHRLVRQYHMTVMEGEEQPMRAQILY